MSIDRRLPPNLQLVSDAGMDAAWVRAMVEAYVTLSPAVQAQLLVLVQTMAQSERRR